MAEIFNLRQARKRKKRAEKDAKSEENRIHFGRSKAEKSLTKALLEKDKRSHDAGKRDRQPPEDDA